MPLRQEPIQIGEVLGPLKALADESRLGLLQLLASQDEMSAQEIIVQVEISQPTVSRHLKQLRNAGIIDQRRGDEAAVNDLLNRWHTFADPAYLRRSLVDEGLLRRTDDGARYWRV